jgi:AcrR family transcriptional regulator
MGKVRAARELRDRGIQLSASAVHSIWTEHGLATSYDRLRRGRAALSEAQRARLRRATISRRLIVRAGARAGANASAFHPRRDELLAAAARVFSTRGYEGASLREICAAAGILPGSMYHHFRSKEDLFVSVHAEGFRHLNEVVDRGLEGKSEPWTRLEAAIGAHLGELVERSDVVAVTTASLLHMEGSHPAAAPQPPARRVRRALPQAHPGRPAAGRCRPQPAQTDPSWRNQLDARLVPARQAHACPDRASPRAEGAAQEPRVR